MTGEVEEEKILCRYVTFYVDGTLIGVPIDDVREVLEARPTSQVPLAPDSVRGLVNLRGQVVTVVDLRTRLDLPFRPFDIETMFIVVKDGNDSICLISDALGDVVETRSLGLHPPPASLNAVWRTCARGVCRTDRGELVVVIDTQPILDGLRPQAIAQ